MEISFEAWEGVQRHGQDLADRLAQGFTGLLHAPPQFQWPPAAHKRTPFEIDLPVVPFGSTPRAGAAKEFPFPAAAVSSVIDIGGRLGQAGVEIGASIGGAVQHVVRKLPLPVRFRDGQIGRRNVPPPTGAASVSEGDVGLSVARPAVDRCPSRRPRQLQPRPRGARRSPASVVLLAGMTWTRTTRGSAATLGLLGPSRSRSVCPTFGGSDPGICAEVAHSLKEELNLICGLSCSRHPSAFTAFSP